MERGNAKLYGIRFNLDHQTSSASPTDSQWFLPPYAWLEKDDQWYLIKIFTPWIANLFPRYLTKFPHQAWQVTPDEVLNNDIFRLHEYHQPNLDYAASGSLGAAGGYSGIGALPLVLIGIFLPTDNKLSFWPAYLLYFATILISYFFFSFLMKFYNYVTVGSSKNPIKNYSELEAQIKSISQTHVKKHVLISQIKTLSGLVIVIKVVCLTLFLIVFLPFTYGAYRSSTSMVVFMGIIVGMDTFFFLVLGCFKFPSRITISNHVDQIIVSKIE
ncbi:hypothetical protein [Fructilactobacillus florum]|nr:hypothetical protein [Fructilactobacillus florum]